ncbi:MAG: ribbon-helix-helix protein, CopG family [Methanothrix sp.]|nr:ribbon-helix-helix protein, CopG family [Methanothrix sp.]
MKTTVVLPEDLHERVKRAAAARRESMGAVIRRAIEKEVSDIRPRLTCIGIGDSGRTDISARIGEEGFEPEPWR